MNARLRVAFTHTALGPAIVIWGFGYLLVDIVAFLLGRSAPGQNLFFSIPMFVLGVAQTLALHRFRKALQPRTPALRWPLLAVLVAIATAIQSLFDVYWLRWVSTAFLPSWQEWALDVGAQRLSTVGILYLWTFGLALTLLWAARVSTVVEASSARAASAEAAAARAEASQHRAEAAALRLQLNPHFLFNTLNSISSLVVVKRGDEAEEMIERLCDFLRASLNADPMADVSLAQEIDSIDAYLAIEEARFGERLEIDIDIDGAVTTAQVPNFILQPLVENAIKHGVSSIRGPAFVRVAATAEGEDLVLTVENSTRAASGEQPTGKTAPPARVSTGIGLNNIKQRLAHRYGDRAELQTAATEDGFTATIRLPLSAAPHP